MTQETCQPSRCGGLSARKPDDRLCSGDGVLRSYGRVQAADDSSMVTLETAGNGAMDRRVTAIAWRRVAMEAL